jgi:hypothetical protein
MSCAYIKKLLHKLLFINIVIIKSLGNKKFRLNSAFKKHVFINSKTNGTVIINNSKKHIIYNLLLISFIFLSTSTMVLAEDLVVYHNLTENAASFSEGNLDHTGIVNLEVIARNQIPTDLIISLDSSGSMSESSTMIKRLEIINKIIDLMNDDKDRIGFINWNKDIVTEKGLTSNFNEIHQLINDIPATQNFTCIGKALDRSISLFDNNGDRKKIIIILTDGRQNCSNDSDFASIDQEQKN